MLDLTFIGWLLLAGLTFGIFLIWLQPYYRQTDIGCFQTIKRIKGIGRLPEQELPGGDGFDPFA